MALNENELAQFRQQGFIAIEQLVDANEVSRLHAILTRLLDGNIGFSEGAQYDAAAPDGDPQARRFPQMLAPHVFSNELIDSDYFRKAHEIARQCLGETARFKGDIAFMKPARIGSVTPWHQDVAFGNPGFQCQEISFWLALTAANSTNSCLSFVPGSHRFAVLDHQPMNGDPSNHALECIGDFDASTAIECPLPAGGCTIHTDHTLHKAGPNLSDSARIAYVLEFDTPLIRRKRPLDFPWQKQQRQTDHIIRRTKWRRRGGYFILLWRHRNRITVSRMLGGLLHRRWGRGRR